MQKNVFPISPHGALRNMSRLLAAVALLFILYGFSATTSTSPVNDGWVFHKSVNNVDFYHRLINCDGKNVVLLKFNNKNDHKVKVLWKEVFTTQLEKAAEGYNGQKQLFVGPGETFSTGCNDDKIKELLILPQQVAPTYIVSILGFEYKDIDVSLVL